MGWGRSHVSIKDRINNKKEHLKDYSDQELYSFLQQNETIDSGVLACVCAEVLRRRIEFELEQERLKRIIMYAE